MRRITYVLVAFCLLCGLLAAPVCAAERTYYLEEAGLSVTVPDSLAAFTRDYSPDDPEIKAFGLTDQVLQSVFYAGNNYLLAIDRRSAHEVLLSAIENGSTQADFEYLSEPLTDDMTDMLVEQYAAVGMQILEEPRAYQHGQVNFLVLNYKYYAGEIPIYCLAYISAYEGKSVGLTLRSYLGLVTEEQETLMAVMVDSVVFDGSEGSAAPTAPEETPEQSVAPADPEETPEQSTAPADPGKTPETLSAGDLAVYMLLTVLITAIVYNLPLSIYRYAIRRRPVPRKQAKKITVIYAFAFLIFASVVLFTSIYSGAAILTVIVWSFVNYRTLVREKKDD